MTLACAKLTKSHPGQYICVNMSVYMCMYIWMCIYMCINVCVYRFTYEYMHICTCAHRCVHTQRTSEMPVLRGVRQRSRQELKGKPQSKLGAWHIFGCCGVSTHSCVCQCTHVCECTHVYNLNWCSSDSSHLLPHSPCWDYKHVLLWELGFELRPSYIQGKGLTKWAIFPAPGPNH